MKGMHQPRSDDAGVDPFGLALDEVLRAFSANRELRREDLAALYPQLGDVVDEVLELAREIAILRPTPLPRIPGYEVLGEVGRGGMGVVYRALQHGVDRVVALKVLPEAFGADLRGRSRFLAEARGLGRVRHAHVVTIHGVVETADVVAYAMEWVDGRSLASLLEELAGWPRRGAVPAAHFGGEGSARLPDPAVPWFCRLGIAIARALGEVHRHGLVHRDVKPGNVLLRADGTALLSDFGLVRAEQLGLTRTGQVVGTPAFAAPEQLRSDHDAVGARSDIWGLGATLHGALAGQVPFAGRTPLELLANIEARRRDSLVACGMPRDLETIVARCLEPEARDRYATADAVADDLENLLAMRPVTARPLGRAARVWRLLRRNRRLVVASAVSGVLVLAVCAMLGLWIWHLVTLPARFEAQLLAARFALLEPTHEERVELAKMGKPPERPSAFATSGDQALAAYDMALALDGARSDVVLERDLVALAQSLLRKAEPKVSDALRAAAPLVCEAAVAWHEGREFDGARIGGASTVQRRALGLLAFLTGRVNVCHEAWRELELAGDTFIDAAAGQMHLQRGEIPIAMALLARAAQSWDQAGFLAVALADCAVRSGELPVAERELARADGLDRKDPFSTHKRVLADLRAAQGRATEARELYEWVIARHFADTARVHYIAMLERVGDSERALELRLDRFERGSDDNRGELEAAFWKWWTQQPFVRRQHEFFLVLTESSDGLLRRVSQVRGGRGRESKESTTLNTSHSSPEDREAAQGFAYLMELSQMKDLAIDPNGKRVFTERQALAATRACHSLLSPIAQCLPRAARRMAHGVLYAAALGIIVLTSDAKAQTFSDGNFIGWSSQVFLDTTSSGSWATPSTGGSPGACSQTTTTHVGTATTAGVAYVGRWSPSATWDPAASGPIKSITGYVDAHLSYRSLSSGGCAFYPFFYQGGVFYSGPGSAWYPVTVPTNWQLVSLIGGGQNLWGRILNPVVSGAPFIHPDFSATGSPLYFGVMVGHTSGAPPAGTPYTVIAEVDNWTMTITPAGLFSTFGAGCAGTNGTPVMTNDNFPGLGFQHFRVRVQNAVPSLIAVPIFGGAPIGPPPLDLASIGAPGCSVYVNPDVLLPLSPVDPSGAATTEIQIPNLPQLVNYTFYLQWAALDPAANAFGFTTSNAAACTIE